MFGIEKEKLINNLEKIRNDVCAYSNSKDHGCDCKFGKEEDKCHNPLHENFSGCCELRQAITILKNMSDDYFKRVCVYSGIIL